MDISRISFENMEIDAKGFCKFYYWMATGSVFDNIRFENVTLRVMDSEEARPPIVADDATYETVGCAWK